MLPEAPMDAPIRLRIQALPPPLRESLEVAEMLMHDCARRVAEGSAPMRSVEEARELFTSPRVCPRLPARRVRARSLCLSADHASGGTPCSLTEPRDAESALALTNPAAHA